MTTYTRKYNHAMNRQPVPVFRWTAWHAIVGFIAGIIFGWMIFNVTALAAKRAKSPVSVEYRCGEY